LHGDGRHRALPAAARRRAADEAVAAIAAALRKTARPLLLVGRVSPDQAAWDRRVELAEVLGADVLTDLKVGARFPTRHPAHREPPGLSATAGGLAMIREADMVVSLDWVDLGGTLRLAHAGARRAARSCSARSTSTATTAGAWRTRRYRPRTSRCSPIPTGWSRSCSPCSARRCEGRAAEARNAAGAIRSAVARAFAVRNRRPMPLQAMAEAAAAILAPEKPCYIRLPIGWPGDVCKFTTALDYLGFDGAGGIGSGPGMAVGAAFALQDSDRLPVAIIGDGDFLMSVTALWTAVHLRLPLLVVVANNRSFFNDELHQDRIARERGRPVENRGVAIRIDDPAPDLATLARGQGAVGYGPVATLAALRSTLTVAIAKVRGGATCVVDVHVAREYARGIPAAVLSEKADT
jgi:thiamine pyrophosphate-dependent acetolactate synthase large subunit-like protein